MSFLISATDTQIFEILYDNWHSKETKGHFVISSYLILQSPLFTDLHHLAQFCQVAGDEVEEGELVKVLGPLVAHFHNLVVTLQQCRLTQTLPAAAFIQGLGCLQRHLKCGTKQKNVTNLVIMKKRVKKKKRKLERVYIITGLNTIVPLCEQKTYITE